MRMRTSVILMVLSWQLCICIASLRAVKPIHTVYPKKYAHGFCFAVLCCGYTLTDFPISIRLTSLALWQSNDCPSASKATLMNMDKYFMWIHYERLHNHNKAKHNKTVCIFLGIYCNVSVNTAACDPIITWLPFLPIQVYPDQLFNGISWMSWKACHYIPSSVYILPATFFMIRQIGFECIWVTGPCLSLSRFTLVRVHFMYCLL